MALAGLLNPLLPPPPPSPIQDSISRRVAQPVRATSCTSRKGTFRFADSADTGNVTKAQVTPISPYGPVHIAVVGVGFVGESLLRAFATCFNVTGYDISEKRIEELTPTLSDLPKASLSCNETDIATATHYLISVPTLLKSDRSVDLSYVEDAVNVVMRYARPGACIILESSVTVGTTRKLLGPFSTVFHCGMSPERVDPGRVMPSMHDIPKIVSALSPASLEEISKIYSKAFTTLIKVSNPEVAEFTKLFENCYRMVNIAYVNEMADACRSHGIDPAEVIEAAASKPYGFQKFIPGLGVGGHCIPINPFYLLANCKNLPVLERATKEMAKRPWKMAKKFHHRCKVAKAVKSRVSTSMHGENHELRPRILVVGIAFKPGQSVLSCSPGLDFARCLAELGCARLAFHDPAVPAANVAWMNKLVGAQWTAKYLKDNFDGIAVCMRQQGINWDVLDGLKEVIVRSYV